LKKWMTVLGVVVVLLGACLGAGCGRNGSGSDTDDEPEVGAVALTVSQPQNETTVYAAALEVKGKTEADAVLSVNGVTVEVNADGSFSTTVTLEEGPNPIEVLASDFEGNEGSSILTVIYVKQ
jgi:uncharacterized protein YfaP (DUF2135 family)